jgi:hypothetical protein
MNRAPAKSLFHNGTPLFHFTIARGPIFTTSLISLSFTDGRFISSTSSQIDLLENPVENRSKDGKNRGGEYGFPEPDPDVVKTHISPEEEEERDKPENE